MEGTPWVSSWRAEYAPADRAPEQLVRATTGHDLIAVDDGALQAKRFSVPDGIDVTQRFAQRQGRFLERPAMIRLNGGLGVTAAVDANVLDVIFACDGRRTLGQPRNEGHPGRTSIYQTLLRRFRSAPWELTVSKPSGETGDKAFVRCSGRSLTTNLEGVGNPTRLPGANRETCVPWGGRSRWHEYEHDPDCRNRTENSVNNS